MRVLVTGGAGFIGSQFVRATLSGELPGLVGAEVTVFDKLTYAGNRANLDPVADSPGLHLRPGRHRRRRAGRRGPAGPRRGGALRRRVARRPLDRGRRRLRHHQRGRHPDPAGRRLPAQGRQVRPRLHRRGLRLDRRGLLARGAAARAELPVLRVQGGRRPDRPGLRPHARARRRRSPAAPTTTGPTSSRRRSSRCSSPTCSTAARSRSTATARNVRDWLHVDDHCRGIALVATGGRGGEVYNIGGGTELTNLELTERLIAALGADWSQVVRVADRKGHDRRYSVDISKIADELGYAPQVPFASGLADTVTWYAENRAWWEPLKTVAALA